MLIYLSFVFVNTLDLALYVYLYVFVPTTLALLIFRTLIISYHICPSYLHTEVLAHMDRRSRLSHSISHKPSPVCSVHRHTSHSHTPHGHCSPHLIPRLCRFVLNVWPSPWSVRAPVSAPVWSRLESQYTTTDCCPNSVLLVHSYSCIWSESWWRWFRCNQQGERSLAHLHFHHHLDKSAGRWWHWSRPEWRATKLLQYELLRLIHWAAAVHILITHSMSVFLR